MPSCGRGLEEKMSRDVYDEWNDDGTLPALKPCPFCGSAGVLNDNGYERPVIDMDTGAYINMDIKEGDGFWCECPECGAILPGADTPEGAIEQWNRRDDPPNDPLTLDELREMDGEPVWVVIDGDDYAPCWMLLKYHAGRAFYSECFSVGLDNYGKGWTAYRRGPEEEKR